MIQEKHRLFVERKKAPSILEKRFSENTEKSVKPPNILFMASHCQIIKNARDPSYSTV